MLAKELHGKWQLLLPSSAASSLKPFAGQNAYRGEIDAHV